MLDRALRQRGRRPGLSALFAAAAVLLVIILDQSDSFPQAPAKKLPTSPPPGYARILPCHTQFGALWAPSSVSQPMGGNEAPMLGFYEGQLTAMIFHLSEKHLHPSLPGGGMLGFMGTVNATVSSITIAPAQYRPQRDRRAYELTVMVYHDQPVTVTCSSTMPSTSQGNKGQIGGSTPNQPPGVPVAPPPPPGGFGGGMKKTK